MDIRRPHHCLRFHAGHGPGQRSYLWLPDTGAGRAGSRALSPSRRGVRSQNKIVSTFSTLLRSDVAVRSNCIARSEAILCTQQATPAEAMLRVVAELLPTAALLPAQRQASRQIRSL